MLLTDSMNCFCVLSVLSFYYGHKKNLREIWQNVHPAENRTGLQIEIATSLSVLEQIFFLLWVGICIEIVHTKFCDLRWKIVVLATLKSWVPKNSFFSKKIKICRLFGAIIFHLGQGWASVLFKRTFCSLRSFLFF